MIDQPSRRAILSGATALFAMPAAAQDGGRYASVAVDVRPLVGRGLGEYADRVGAVLAAELRRAFADRIAGSAPRLVVRIDAISLRAYAGSDSRLGFGGGSPSDYLEGVALVIGGRGEILRSKPQLSAVPASSGGAWYDPESENRRVVALAAHFAGWLRRDPP